MTPLKLDVINSKSLLLKKEIKLLLELKKLSKSARDEPVAEHALCHAIQNAIAIILDICEHIVTEKTGNSPQSYSDSIIQMGEIGILNKRFAAKFSKIAGMRNIIVHRYAELDMEILWSAIEPLRKDSTAFIAALGREFKF